MNRKIHWYWIYRTGKQFSGLSWRLEHDPVTEERSLHLTWHGRSLCVGYERVSPDVAVLI